MTEPNNGVKCEACKEHYAIEYDEIGRALCALCVEPYPVEVLGFQVVDAGAWNEHRRVQYRVEDRGAGMGGLSLWLRLPGGAVNWGSDNFSVCCPRDKIDLTYDEIQQRLRQAQATRAGIMEATQ